MNTPEPDVTPTQAYAATGTDVVLLDVREDDEWDAGHAPGAVHVPLGSLDPTRLDTSTPVIAICRSGGRSGHAAALLAIAGCRVQNMAGGMNAWHTAGLPVVRDDGSPGGVM